MSNSNSPEIKLPLEREVMAWREAMLERTERLAAHAYDIRFGELPSQAVPAPRPETSPQFTPLTGAMADEAIKRTAHYGAYDEIAGSRELDEIHRRIDEAYAEGEAA